MVNMVHQVVGMVHMVHQVVEMVEMVQMVHPVVWMVLMVHPVVEVVQMRIVVEVRPFLLLRPLPILLTNYFLDVCCG
jgi:hypothetical protein